MLGIKYFKTLEDTLDNALESIGFNAKNDTFTTYFTSDTHFSQERTLEFSKRPFISTDEMDLAMISNWNKKVTMNDDVFHAGDLGDLDKIRDIIGCLNFRTLTIIPWNYERKEYDKFKKAVKGLRNVTIEENGFGFTEKESNFYIVHEPLTPALENADTKFGKDNYCVLFGHTHNRGNVKRNGINIGTDCWGFTPISIDEVLWLDNARKNFWDENVFTPVCLNRELTTADMEEKTMEEKIMKVYDKILKESKTPEEEARNMLRYAFKHNPETIGMRMCDIIPYGIISNVLYPPKKKK